MARSTAITRTSATALDFSSMICRRAEAERLLALGRLDGVADGLLALLDETEDRSPGHAAEDEDHQREGDQGPEDQARVDVDETGEHHRHGENLRVLRAAGHNGSPPTDKPSALETAYLVARMMQTTSAKRVTPSMSAAAMIMLVRISAIADGWRLEPSIADAASLPMPMPAPMTAKPAPMPAERYASAMLFM
jgi:hypothetical protein